MSKLPWGEDLKTDISSEGAMAKRLVKNHSLANNLEPYTTQITNPTVRVLRVHVKVM